MRTMPQRGERGRFIGRTQILEHAPRLTAKAASRVVADPRGCAYAVAWRAEDSMVGAFERRTGEEHAGRIERHGDALLVTIAGRSTLVRLKRTTPFRNAGWFVLLRCPGCGRTTQNLYLRGVLRCRRCAGLRWGCEGRRRVRIERQLLVAICGIDRLERTLGQSFGERLLSWKFEEKPWEARVRPLAGPLLSRRPKRRGRRPRVEVSSC